MADGNSQDKILYQLKRLGPLSAKQLGQALTMTTMGARQHLARLEEAGLVMTQPEESVGRGRPLKRWKLTEAGHGRFPDGHAQVTSDLLIAVTDLLGPDALDQLIERRTETTLKQYREVLDPLPDTFSKLQALAELRSQEGYMAEVEAAGDGFRLLEHHCPICIAATTCQGFCRSELRLFQDVLGPDVAVERIEHLLSGDRRCMYRIRPQNDA